MLVPTLTKQNHLWWVNNVCSFAHFLIPPQPVLQIIVQDSPHPADKEEEEHGIHKEGGIGVDVSDDADFEGPSLVGSHVCAFVHVFIFKVSLLSLNMSPNSWLRKETVQGWINELPTRD